MLKFFINLAKILDILTGNYLPENTIGKLLREKGKTIAIAESCTGGLISSLLTDISGSSEYIFANFTTYSNEAKMKYLGVSAETLKKYGAVSPETAKEMVEGLLKNTDCDFAIATTGIAGPTGGTDTKPVGLMYLGLASRVDVKIIKIQQEKELYRRIMKIAFAKRALNEFLYFIR